MACTGETDLPRAFTAAPSLPRPELAMRVAERAKVLRSDGFTGTADGGETGVMEPFEVKEESNIGYTARDTLAGTRINTKISLLGGMVRTEFKDVASSVSTASSASDSARGDFLQAQSRALQFGLGREGWGACTGRAVGRCRGGRCHRLPRPSRSPTPAPPAS